VKYTVINDIDRINELRKILGLCVLGIGSKKRIGIQRRRKSYGTNSFVSELGKSKVQNRRSKNDDKDDSKRTSF
jgi:hypothetical protein